MIPERYSGYETRLRAGAVDFTPVPGDVAANLDKLTGWISEAAAAGVGLLVFPEEALTGAIHCDDCEQLGRPCELHRSLAETVPGPSTEALARLAAEHDMYLVVGMIEEDFDDPEVLYNAAAVIGPEGILGTYRKLHLGSLPFVTEGVSFRPGTNLDVFETRYGPIGVQICYDFWLNPEGSRLLALQGARIIVNPTAAFAGGPAKLESMRRVAATRGQENFVFTISANQVSGVDASDELENSFDGALPANYAGHSLICGPDFPDFSHIYAEGGDAEGLVVADLDFEVLHRWDDVCPWRQWRATHQSGTSELFATEFAKLVHGPQPSNGGIMSTEPRVLKFDDIEWVDESKNPNAPKELIEKAKELGAGRKHVARGEGGFWCQYTTMPAGYHVPPHSHDQNELLIVVSGGCEVWSDGAGAPSMELGPKDSVILAANHEYSFTCGADGMEFFVLRPGDSASSFDKS